MIPTINFIGCGRLGKTIAKLLQMHQLAKINSVMNSTIKNATQATEFIGAGFACDSIAKMLTSDIYFITTPDDIIQSICDKLVNENRIAPGAILVHCSGSLSSDILQTAKHAQCYIASVHPIKSFAKPELAIHQFKGTYCAIEGDPYAIDILKIIFEQIGGIVFAIKKEQKNLYHAASVLANNYLISLHFNAVQCYQAAGLDGEMANKIASMLMQDALNNLNVTDHQGALTGPIQRGDSLTIRNHLQVLNNNDVIKQIYKYLGLGALPFTTHSAELCEELVSIFEN